MTSPRLRIEDVLPYLLERDLVSARTVVDGGLKIADMSRRNRVFVVTARDAPGFVVKQPGDENGTGVRREAIVLDRLRAGDPRLAARLPVPVAFDRGSGVLVLEAARDAQDLRARHARGRFSREAAAHAGRTLALLHAAPLAVLRGQAADDEPNWTLQLHRPSLTTVQHAMTDAAGELVGMIQRSDELCAALDDLHATRREDTVVHGDLRWENVLTARAERGSSARRSRVLLLDWESAARGDPSHDLGAFFGEYLHCWLRSIPVAGAADPAALLAHATRPLASMRPALAAFWLAYARHAAAAPAELGRRLRRAVSYAAVRVLTSAFEESLSQHRLRPSGRLAPQVSANIMARPDEAIAHLLGLSAAWPRS